MPVFAKFDGIEGESQQAGAEGYIEIEGFNMAAYAPESSDFGGGQGAIGKPQYQPISFGCVSGKHTSDLIKKFNEGKHHDSLEVLIMKPTGAASAEWFRKFTFKHVYLVNYNQSISGGDSGQESMTIKFEEIKQEYKKQNPDGSLVAAGDSTYNNKTNIAS